MIEYQQRIEKVKRVLCCMARQCWEQGLAAQAMLEMHDTELMLIMARDCVVRQNKDGRLCDVEGTPALIDPAICVEPVLEAGRLLNDSACREAANKNIAYLLYGAPRTEDGAIYHLTQTREVWADALGMGPHVLMMAGNTEAGFRLYNSICRRLRNTDTGLFHHKWDEASQRFKREDYWSVGNGWALVGQMRMALSLYKTGDPQYRTILSDFLTLVDSMAGCQREDGLFYDVLDDARTYVETESAEMLAYALYRMIGAGLIDGRYLVIAEKARRGVNRMVDEEGYVRGCAGSPSFDYSGTSAEGQAHYLMMEVAAAALGLKPVV